MTRRQRARERRAYNLIRRYHRSQGVPASEIPAWANAKPDHVQKRYSNARGTRAMRLVARLARDGWGCQ